MLGLIIVIGIAMFVGVALLILLLTKRTAADVRLQQVALASAPVSAAIPSRVATVSTITKLVVPLRNAVGLSEDTDVTRRLALAGYRNRVHVDSFYGAKCLAPVAGALIAGFVLRDNVIFWFIALSALGFYLPDLWLMRAISLRREDIRMSLPDALDLLVVCMEAGLGMDQALIRVGEELRISHKALSEEFLLVNLEQRAGKPRVDAWRNLAQRTNLEMIRSFVNMLVQTERFGTPLSKSLGQFADALRTRRRQQAEEMAAKTTIKLVFPLVFFIFPSMFIVLLGPALISIARSFGESFGK